MVVKVDVVVVGIPVGVLLLIDAEVTSVAAVLPADRTLVDIPMVVMLLKPVAVMAVEEEVMVVVSEENCSVVAALVIDDERIELDGLEVMLVLVDDVPVLVSTVVLANVALEPIV